MDPEKLLVKVSLGKQLSDVELSEVVHALTQIDVERMAATGLVDEAYALLHLLGKAKAYQSIQLLEKYLEAKDALTVSLVLEILCLDWDRTEGYIERLIDFSLGVSWDEEDDVRQTALKILGEYLRRRLAAEEGRAQEEGKKKTKKNRRQDEAIHVVSGSDKTRRVLELLFGFISDIGLSQSTRQGAYFALCRAAGKEWDELPSECAMLSFEAGSSDLDQALLDNFQRLLAES
jgi:hypothetical protein